ncbi:MAG: diacylglycerol kinase family lipid kinase [Fidelibacterota bacterium]|nr:MAG: diacylglycerol kinase family lipid kinase [Candidatus Neomarinimicrobiota bacterium]
MGRSAQGKKIASSLLNRLCLAVNPHGGRKTGQAVLEKVKPVFDEAGIKLDIFETEYAGHARDFVRKLDLAEWDAFCAIGGDGMMHEMVNGLLARPDQRQLPLGLIPAGTGNSFLYGFGCHDPVDAAQRIVAGESQIIDVAQVSLGERSMFSCNIIGWGLITDISILAEQLRWLGENRYTVASAIEVMKAKRRQARLNVDGQETEGDFIFVLACNTQYTGKGMRMAPHADLSDGLIDLIIVRDASRLQMLRLLPKVFDGSHVKSPLVEYVQAKEFSLIPEVDEIVNVDGELIDPGPIAVSMLPQAIQVLI